MDNNKNLRNKLNTPSLDLPEELDWSNMKEGIFSKMETAQNEKRRPIQKRNKLYIYIISLIILILLIIRMCVNPIWSPQETDATKQAVIASNDEPTRFSNRTATNHKAEKDIFQGSSGVSEEAQNQSSGPNATETPGNSSLRRDRDKADIGSRGRSGSMNSEGQNAPMIWAENPITNFDTSSKNQRLDNRAGDINPKPLKSTLDALSKLDLMLLHRLDKSDMPNLVATSVSKNPNVSNKKHKIGFLGGISVWDPGFSNNLPERTTFESAQLSFSHHFKYEYHTDNNFFFTTGLRLHLLNSRFDWSTPINDYKIKLTDVVVEQITNALSGEVEYVRGDVEIEVDAERIVRHHNRITVFELPVGLGTSRRIGPFDLSLELGSSINILGKSRGRTLHQGEIVDLDASGHDLFDSQWGINGFVSLRMNYFIDNSWSFNLGINYQKAITDWSLEENTQMRPQILTLDLGMGYRF